MVVKRKQVFTVIICLVLLGWSAYAFYKAYYLWSRVQALGNKRTFLYPLYDAVIAPYLRWFQPFLLSGFATLGAFIVLAVLVLLRRQSNHTIPSPAKTGTATTAGV